MVAEARFGRAARQVCFGGMQRDLLLYRYRGLDFSVQGDAATAPLPDLANDFDRQGSLPLAHGCTASCAAFGDSVCRFRCRWGRITQWLITACVRTVMRHAENTFRVYWNGTLMAVRNVHPSN